MTKIDSVDALAGAHERSDLVKDNVRGVADWFHDREGELFDRHNVIHDLADDFDLTPQEANTVLSDLVGDIVDPVIQIDDGETLWVGVIDYESHDFWYQYTDFDPFFGEQPKGVCAQCVHEATFDKDVAYAMPGYGTLSTEDGIEEVEEVLTGHFKKKHPGVEVETIETGASLLSPTTIGGNEAIHKGNMASEADAVSVGGKAAADLAPTYNDGTRTCHIISTERFGAEGSSTTSTGYTTIAGSDITFNPDDYKDGAGNLYVRVYAHLKHGTDAGTAYARMYRQNAATVVTGTAVSVTATDGWGIGDSGWVALSDTGYDSYHLQIKSGDGNPASYNSVILQFGVPA